MRVARHDRGLIALGALHERALEFAYVSDDGIDFVAAIQTHVQCDLIIATAGGVELRAGGADALRQLGLDVHVDVFQGLLPLEVPAGDLLFDREQASLNRGLLLGL